jgi:Protein of unknown function (DUF4238)
MSEPKHQHYVPQCYLREFTDPNTPSGQEPYVWIFEKGSKKGKKKAPKNILSETDIYTLKVKGGKKNYSIEKSLSNIESEYASIFRNKIRNKLPLSEYEHVIVCLFVACMLQRTTRYRDNLNNFYDQLIERAEALEKAHNADPKGSVELKKEKEDAHKLSMMQTLPKLVELLMHMSLAFICTGKSRIKFITSDDPCTLTNPALQGQRFYGPGLGQERVELTLPLSPEVMLHMCWANVKGYLELDESWIQELNRQTRGHSYEYFISHTQTIRRYWFSKYPKNLRLLAKAIRYESKFKIHDLKYWYLYGRRNKI